VRQTENIKEASYVHASNVKMCWAKEEEEEDKQER
jgi:hypothetical protein